MKIPLVQKVLEANQRIADENRRLFEEAGVLAINLLSGPGAGKTSLLEKTIDGLKDRYRFGVIEGDIQSTRDAEKIASTGVPVVQINTGGACHLDGNMIREALEQLDLGSLDILVVENVGNLVCPAEFDVGEDFKVMLLSLPEGDDKPLKYPLIFHESSLLLINKIDLLPHLECDVEKIRNESLKLNPRLGILEISCKTGEGLQPWFDWLTSRVKKR
ncbi:MAG: hydrogenase nickel incorporation protein HypB [Deltaproteobacteria bacterium]|nr:hydrogenase nickel incorporation protein HypB [Deltaproteobacteria bacterium]MBW2123364.1 hydrogenase nickel incorporation protein HypB [Deltaproteobacteria bacterium]